MSSVESTVLPDDFPQRIKDSRNVRGLTQEQFAKLIGVSFATVNRWENGQSRPNNLAWQRVVELDNQSRRELLGVPKVSEEVAAYAPRDLDFSADPDAVLAVAEAHRLTYGHLFNPAFATETSLIDPLPHQRIAVYHHMLKQSPLRFLLADDAGAGKTIMTGLYIREMLSRRLIRRVLVVPPAGLVGNWEREMRTLFRLHFRILSGADARTANPFAEAGGDLVIVSIDTLAGDRMFGRLRDASTEPYDLVVFDEAHKLSANWDGNRRIHKTARYKLAETIAGAGADSEAWRLGWSAQHLLLLTATPHMGKDVPYYFLWRLLMPDTLSTYEAFSAFPSEDRSGHFIRRTKEEMVRFDGEPLYPQRRCDTLSYELSQGPGGEQELYDETTAYIRDYYNRASKMNRSAARLAMSVFQRRLASSTYALLRSFERRKERLRELIDEIRSGEITEAQLPAIQRGLDKEVEDVFETHTADEDSTPEGDGEKHEDYESRVLGGTVAVSLAELDAERRKVDDLLTKTRVLFEAGRESKFEKLRQVLRDPAYLGEKFIVFTEHRDTANFLVRRLEGLGFTGQVAQIHGGMPYRERERQVAFFRKTTDEDGADYLVATDAAGEGINLQFCWLMINYDLPWNPARLEQRMGRIHRYGQKHDPVVIVNLIAGGTREGHVMKTLLDKLEAIRRQLDSDKVFDVIGRLFEDVSLKEYLERAVTEADPDEALRSLEGQLTEEQVRALEERGRALYGEGGDVRRGLDELNEEAGRERYRRLLPGYVRRFVEKAAPLLGLRVAGDPGGYFSLVAMRPKALDPLLPALELHPEALHGRLTVYRPREGEEAIWLHPGEPVFDRLAASVMSGLGDAARKGAIFVDPAADEPYLFHLALVTVERAGGVPGPHPAEPLKSDEPVEPVELSAGLPGGPSANASAHPGAAESRLVGLIQKNEGSAEESPVEHLLLLRGVPGFAPSRVPLAALARGMMPDAAAYTRDVIAEGLAQGHRQRLINALPRRLEFLTRGFDYQAAELASVRAKLTPKARSGDQHALSELSKVKERQRGLAASRERRLETLKAEADQIRSGEVAFLAHALVIPAYDSDDIERYDADVEAIAMDVATAYEEGFGATVEDVSRPELARRAGLTDWPGFDLRSRRPASDLGEREERAIEVKGRAGTSHVELSANEWYKACNLGKQYWLYVVFDCATPNPRLVRVCDPFGRLIMRDRETSSYTVAPTAVIEAAE